MRANEKGSLMTKTDIAIRALRAIQELGRNDAVGKTLMLMEADQALHAIEMLDRRADEPAAVHRDPKTGARVDNPPEPPDPDPLF